MKIIFIILFALAFQLEVVYSQIDTIKGHPLGFVGYMDLVKKHNLDYAAEQFEVNKSEAAIEIAKVFPDPTLSFDMTQNREGKLSTGHDLTSEIGTTLELFGKRRARIDLAKSSHDLSKALLADFYRNLQGDAATVFLEALKQKQLYSVKLNSYQTMKRLAEADSLRLRSGSIMEIDAIQSKLEATSLFNEVLQSESDLKNGLIQLSQMTGLVNADSILIPKGSLLSNNRSFNINTLINVAMNNRSDLVAALNNKEVADKALRLAKKERNIDVDVKMGIQNGYQPSIKGPTATAFTAGIAIPLKLSNYYKGQVRLAQFEIAQSEDLYLKAELNIKSEIIQALQRYQAYCKQVDSFDHGLLEGAQNVRKGKIYSYNRGETSLLEVLNSQRTFNDIQQSYYETLFNRAVALVELEKAAGIWDVEF